MAQIPIKSYGDTNISQKINYKLLYYLGNEYSTTDVSTSKYAIATGGWVNDIYLYASNTKGFIHFKTNNIIDITPFISPKWKAFMYRDIWNNSANVGSSYYTNNQFGGGLTPESNHRLAPAYTSQYTTTNIAAKGFQYEDIINISQPATNPARVGLGFNYTGYYSAAKSTYYLETRANGRNSGGKVYPYAHLYSYAIGFANIDDITYLSQQGYGNTETDIVNSINAPSLITGKTLFNDEQAVKYLVKNCTGSLMIAGLNNSTFVTAMRSSPYFNGGTLLGNEHWGRFIALLDY